MQRENGSQGSDEEVEGHLGREDLEEPRRRDEVPIPAEPVNQEDLTEIIGATRPNPFRVRDGGEASIVPS